VMDDLREGRISAAAAVEVYGVVIVDDVIDADATRRERETRTPTTEGESLT